MLPESSVVKQNPTSEAVVLLPYEVVVKPSVPKLVSKSPAPTVVAASSVRAKASPLAPTVIKKIQNKKSKKRF